MISLHTKNLKTYTPKYNKKELNKLLENFAKRNQDFYGLVDDESTVKKILSTAKKLSEKFPQIVVLGIGGSALPAKLINEALAKNPDKLSVLDSIDITTVQALEKKIELKKTLFIVISKSGTTTETMANYFYFRDKLKRAKLTPKEHFIFITNPDKGYLRENAEKEAIETFDIPKNTSGRFSALTPVGLLPAALVGIDIKKILHGAALERQLFTSSTPIKNRAYQFAKIQHSSYKKGRNINVIMSYTDRLTYIEEWYRQLLAESIGKNAKTGITPAIATGPKDQHSQLQLYSDGPKDKLIIFLEDNSPKKETKIPNPLIKNLSYEKLLEIELESTKKALTKKNRPNISIKIDGISEESLGELLMLFMGQIALLGEMFKINAYNQPGVEAAKKLTKEALLKI